MPAAAAGVLEPVRSLRGRIPADAVVASALGAAALVVYALTFHRDWIYDPMRYAEAAAAAARSADAESRTFLKRLIRSTP